MTSTNGQRRCEGCSEPLSGRQRRFCSDRCRMRQARLAGPKPNGNTPNANKANANVDPVAAPETVPGRAREGLEQWAEGFDAGDLPAGVLEAARALAVEVDKAPTASNLWGRYLDALRQLTDHAEALRDRVRDELAPIFGELQHESDVERWRAERYRVAVAAGEDPSRWTKLIPAACAEGEHRWHDWPAGTRSCLDCDVAGDGTR